MLEITDEMRRCVDNCTQCRLLCLESIPHCLTRGGEHAEAEHITLMTACAQICETCSEFMMLRSEFYSYACGVCAEVCVRCAESCERMADDTFMRTSARACRACAQSCRAMSGQRMSA